MKFTFGHLDRIGEMPCLGDGRKVLFFLLKR